MENYIIQSHKISYNLIHFQTVSYNLIHFDTISYNFVQFHTISYIFIQSHTSSSNLIQSETILCSSNNNMENTGPINTIQYNITILFNFICTISNNLIQSNTISNNCMFQQQQPGEHGPWLWNRHQCTCLCHCQRGQY